MNHTENTMAELVEFLTDLANAAIDFRIDTLLVEPRFIVRR